MSATPSEALVNPPTVLTNAPPGIYDLDPSASRVAFDVERGRVTFTGGERIDPHPAAVDLDGELAQGVVHRDPHAVAPATEARVLDGELVDALVSQPSDQRPAEEDADDEAEHGCAGGDQREPAHRPRPLDATPYAPAQFQPYLEEGGGAMMGNTLLAVDAAELGDPARPQLQRVPGVLPVGDRERRPPRLLAVPRLSAHRSGGCRQPSAAAAAPSGASGCGRGARVP